MQGERTTALSDAIKARQTVSERRNRMPSAGGSAKGARTSEFQGITEGLSARARRVLWKLGVRSVPGLLRLSQKRLLLMKGCGGKTCAEIEALQAKVRSHEKNKVVERPIEFFDPDQAPAEIFGAIVECLDAQAVRALERLGVENLSEFLRLNISEVLAYRECGRRSAAEIVRMQNAILDYAKALAAQSADFNPIELLRAPCLSRQLAEETQKTGGGAPGPSLHPEPGTAAVFDAIVKSLSVRGAGLLEKMAVDNLGDFLRLGEDEMRRYGNCGPKTAAEIVRMQNGILAYANELAARSPDFNPAQLLGAPCLSGQPSTEASSSRAPGPALHPGPGTAAVFDAVVESLSVRGAGLLEKMAVDNLGDFLHLGEDEMRRYGNCGPKTAAEIVRMQNGILDYANELAARSPDFNPAQLLGAPCLSGRSSTEASSSRAPASSADYDDTAKYRTMAALGKPFRFDLAPPEVFEAVKDCLSVRGVGLLGKLGVETLRAFLDLKQKAMRANRNCGRKTAEEIGRMQAGILEYTSELAAQSPDFDLRQLLGAPCLSGWSDNNADAARAGATLVDMDNPAEWLLEWVRGLARKPREAQAFLLRTGMLGSAPMTLERVGQKVGGVTRERVRQLVDSLAQRAAGPHQQHRLRPLFDAMATVVTKYGGLMKVRELIEVVLCRGREGQQLREATGLIEFFSTLPIWQEAGLRLESEGLVSSERARDLIARLADEIVDLARTTADERLSDDLWSVDADRLKETVRILAHVAGLSVDEFAVNALFDIGLRKRSGEVVEDGGRLYSTDLWWLRSGDVSKVAATVLRKMGGPAHHSAVTDRIRAAGREVCDVTVHNSLLDSDDVLSWGPGVFLHRGNVAIPFRLIRTVEQWVLAALAEKDVPFVSVHGVFQQFKGRLKKRGVPSEYALYICLRESARRDLTYPRYPYIWTTRGFREGLPVAHVFEQFLRNAGGPVSRKALRNFAVGKVLLRPQAAARLMAEAPGVIRTPDRCYLHPDNCVHDS
jgi:DNA-directed RNA polymerase alpha subunit